MPGPPPKDPRTLQRRNKVSTRAVLSAAPQSGRPAAPKDGAEVARPPLAPELPVRPPEAPPWHVDTVTFWREVWASPMAAEFIAADVPGLLLVAQLMDRFNYGAVELAGEIRLQRQCFGLTPLDRRRLQWEIERGESAEKRRQRAPGGAAEQPKRANDPRRHLRAVK